MSEADEIREGLRPVPDAEPARKVVPYRIQFNYVGAHMDVEVLEDMMEEIVEFGESLGLIFSFGGIQEMPLVDIVPDSTLAQIVTGQPPRIQ